MLEFVEAVGTRDVERAQQEGVEHAEHDGVGTDGESKGENGGDGESGRTAQLAKRESDVGAMDSSVGHCHTSRLRSSRRVGLPKARRAPALGFLRTHAFAYELLDALFNMEAHLFGELVEELAATEEAGYPVHGKLLLTGWRFTRMEDERNALEHAFEAGSLLARGGEDPRTVIW